MSTVPAKNLNSVLAYLHTEKSLKNWPEVHLYEVPDLSKGVRKTFLPFKSIQISVLNYSTVLCELLINVQKSEQSNKMLVFILSHRFQQNTIKSRTKIS